MATRRPNNRKWNSSSRAFSLSRSPRPCRPSCSSRVARTVTCLLIFLAKPDRRYEVQISTNFSTWQSLDTILATNSLMSFTATQVVGGGLRFYRVLTLP